MSEYLRALKPIVTAQQYERTEKIIRQFSAQPGPKIHQYLVDKREADDNWVRKLISHGIVFIKYMPNKRKGYVLGEENFERTLKVLRRNLKSIEKN